MGSWRRLIQLPWLALLAVAQLGPAALADNAQATVEFNRDVRPILAASCFRCHGPDKARRKAELRLDTEEGARADHDGRSAVVPGDPDASEMLHRLTTEEPEERMPPAESGLTVSPGQIATLRRWIEQGAKWQPHWSLIRPRRPSLPEVSQDEWARNPIDRFILTRLEREGLQPSPPAERTTLIRRVTLDLTGLPPTLEEVDAFLADRAPGAYERVVDRLLSSPRFGERMAKRWLDAARYADTNGYQSDGERTMWRWRDWVIDAFNRNKRFDVFTIEQIAGDMLPGATLDQVLATGFNRNHRGNAEGGIIPEEYAVEYVADRVETTATAWLGLTLGCARCHDHKYDPITQKDFYRVFAYFSNVPEKGRAIKFGNSPPAVASPTPAQQASLAALEARLATADQRFSALEPRIASAQTAWELSAPDQSALEWTLTQDRAARLDFDGTLTCAGERTAAVFRDGKPEFSPGKLGTAADFDGRRYVEIPGLGDFDFLDAFTLAAWVNLQDARGGTVLSKMKDEERGEGYSASIVGKTVRVNLVKRWLDDAIRVEVDAGIAPGSWHHLTVTYDGSRLAEGIKVYVDGTRKPARVLLDELNQTFKSPEPFRVGAGDGPEARFRGRIDEVQVFRAALPPEEVAIVATPERITEIAAIPASARTSGQAAKIRGCFLDRLAPEEIRKADRERRTLKTQRDRLVAGFPTTMVMRESSTPRQTFLLIRGAYDQPGEHLSPGVPAVLPPLPAGAANNRLGFAHWLVDPANPLTSRVAVNGYWGMLFGTGLVKTAEDFGVQGEWPTHPELLDWLATEFVASGWDVKAIIRTLVTSATYRQSSKASPAQLEKDPENHMLVRGPRLRLSAEMIRDQALLLGGLLAERIGGRSVRPYQPDGLWRELAEVKEYEQDHGANLFRRTLYTFWKRTVAPPFMAAFDAASRDRCTVRESRTNTPLQALNLLNDVTFVEAARGLAQRVLKEEGLTTEARLALAFRAATARPPTHDELAVLLDDFRDHCSHFRADLEAARAFIRQGESPRDPALDESELAAYTAVATLILNLDETLTKE
jgi:hypothetical protein